MGFEEVDEGLLRGEVGDKGVESDGARVVKLTNSGFPIAREEAVGRCGWWFGSAFAGSN